jgi:hypothetical protein
MIRVRFVPRLRPSIYSGLGLSEVEGLRSGLRSREAKKW